MAGNNPSSENAATLAAVVPIETQSAEPIFSRRCTLKPVSLPLLSCQVKSTWEEETGVAVRSVGGEGKEAWVKTRMRWLSLSAM